MKRTVFFLIVTLLHSASCFAAGKRFTFITVDFPPYYGSELPDNGWVSEVVKTALELQKYEVEFKFSSWTDALEYTGEGDYDALLGAYRTAERAKNYFFSAPIGQVRTGFFKKKDSGISFTELPELKSYKIGVVQGYATSKKFDAADFLKKIPVANLDDGMKMLYEGKLDLMADSKSVGNYRLTKFLEKDVPGISDNIEFIKPVLAMNKIYIAISKKATNAQKKLIDFNKGLRKIYKNGSFKKIKKKHAIKK
ncbi:transporter substrate-binding domain-containing protein [Candidatus Halobeggiatoa sp. HSG11]|nr:transporter substrate-binding domain-containing protein [Candidatus Halobeggiatoa sp. HSG11]